MIFAAGLVLGVSTAFYQFGYYVSDMKKVTVGEQDRCVGGMLDGIQEFWEQTDLEEILQRNKSDVIRKLNAIAKENSTEHITITVADEEQIGFECLDERENMEYL